MKLWEDGFDHYGSTSHMLDGSYAMASGCAIDTGTFATGNASLLLNGSDSSGGFSGLRFVLPTNTDKIGVAARWYFPSLPGVTDANTIFDFLTSDPNQSQMRCILDANGRLAFYRGGVSSFSSITPGTLVAQSDPIIT